MSRVGKKPILIPENVEVKIEGQRIVVKGPKGELQRDIRPEIGIEIKDYNLPTTLPSSAGPSGKIFVSPKIETKRTRAFWGLTRALLFNMIKGVTEGYERKLEIEGIGFRVGLEGNDLILYVGFSHPVKVKEPQGVNFSVEKNIITVSGIDKELVSQTAANIRKVKPPEPYKGKGIRYAGEVIRRKVGKKVVTAGT